MVRPDPTTNATAVLRPATDAAHAPLRAAAVGTGKISEEHLKFLTGSPRSHLVGVCDLSPALASFAAKRFGADDSYTDYADMLARARPDVDPHSSRPRTRTCGWWAIAWRPGRT